MKPISENNKETCCFNKQHSSKNLGKTYKSVCGKKATHTNGSRFFCRQHSKLGRFVLRNGDVGEILARFDTEEELQDNAHLFPNAELQKLTNSHRKTLLRKQSH